MAPARPEPAAMSIQTILIAAAAGCATACGLSAAAGAQDFNAMNAQFNAQLNAAMARSQQGIVRGNMANPQVRAMYQQYRMQGGRMSFEQYAYAYAATGGFTPQGYANYNQTTRDIAARDARSAAGYRAAQANRQTAMQEGRDHFYANQQEAGRSLQGVQTYYDPASGSNVSMSYIPQGQTYYDPSSGRTYAMAPNGQYMSSSGDGYWTPVAPAQRSPR
jgi:hypothetical protein